MGKTLLKIPSRTGYLLGKQFAYFFTFFSYFIVIVYIVFSLFFSLLFRIFAFFDFSLVLCFYAPHVPKKKYAKHSYHTHIYTCTHTHTCAHSRFFSLSLTPFLSVSVSHATLATINECQMQLQHLHVHPLHLPSLTVFAQLCNAIKYNEIGLK